MIVETWAEARERLIRERAWRRDAALCFVLAVLFAAGLCWSGGCP